MLFGSLEMGLEEVGGKRIWMEMTEKWTVMMWRSQPVPQLVLEGRPAIDTAT